MFKHFANTPANAQRIAVFDSLPQARAEFGENYAGFVFTITRAQAEALLQGKVIAFDINEGEYAGFLTVRDESLETP